jgi:ankyrin repeat protein
MNPLRKRLLIIAASFFLVMAIACPWFLRQYRQSRLDQSLIHAILARRADIVVSLLAAGANPSARYIPENYSALEDLVVVMRHRTRLNIPRTALVKAIDAESNDIVNDLISAGADVNAIDVNGDTALSEATRFGSPEWVEALIKAGANVNARNNTGNSALILAAGEGKPDIISALISAGASIDGKNNFGESALSWAKANHELATAAFLRKAGAK